MASDNFEINIRKALKDDAPHIARAIREAVGEEITLGFAGAPERLPLVTELFTRLAACADSQYSYRNALIAETPAGDIAGVVIAYDGANLHALRERFIENANALLGYNFTQEGMADETSPDEIYIDTICVFSPWRRRGIARRLIEAVAKEHAASRKPLGLLVDKQNLRARSLYEKCGFRQVGERPFAGEMMDHLQRI